MSDVDTSEPMEVDDVPFSKPSQSTDVNPAADIQSSQSADNRPAAEDIQSSQSADNRPAAELSSRNEDVLLTLKFSWLKPVEKPKVALQKLLQFWFNKEKTQASCSVEHIIDDGTALIKIEPAPALIELQKLTKEPVSKEGKTVNILAFSLGSSNLKTQTPVDTSTASSPSFASELPKDEQMKEQSGSAAFPIAEEETCSVPVSHFWYVSHIYQEEIKRIEKDTGVEIKADVKVTFNAVQRDGSPANALSEFTNLVQKSLGESEGSVIPLEYTDPEEWRDAIKTIQEKNKLLLALNSKEITICGPTQSQDLIKKTLKNAFKNASQKTLKNANMSFGDSMWAGQDVAQMIDMSIKDPLADSGLTMEESFWKLLNTSFDKVLAKIKAKFGVDFKESNIGHGKVCVKACHKSGGNPSMESHAVRALLNQYQKCATSPMSFTQYYSGSALNGASTEEGATAGDNKDDICAICLDTFTNKKQLQCKHEFCENCLSKSAETMGPTCPLCRDIFGLIQGYQPEGKMTCKTKRTSLPGFPGCGTIVIHYDMQGGTQSARHPNPTKKFYGIKKKAYLPNNKEGKEVLQLLKRAFDQDLIFTIGLDNQVTWNGIHHKTSKTGGPWSFGYPDPDYLSRVREQLKTRDIM